MPPLKSISMSVLYNDTDPKKLDPKYFEVHDMNPFLHARKKRRKKFLIY